MNLKKSISIFLSRTISLSSRIYLKTYFKSYLFPDHKKASSLNFSNNGVKKRILFATAFGAHKSGNLLESILAEHLILENHNVSHLLCNGFLNFCNVAEFSNSDHTTFQDEGSQGCGLCNACELNGKNYWKNSRSNRLNIDKKQFKNDFNLVLRQIIKEDLSISEIVNYNYNGYNVGEHAKSSTLRYNCVGILSNNHKKLLIKYLSTNISIIKILEQKIKKFDTVVCFHGIYTPHGIIGDICRKNNIHLINWNTSYRKSRFIFTLSDTYHRVFINEPDHKWKNIIWNNKKEKLIVDYIKSREEGTQDWQQFNEKPKFNINDFKGVDWSKTFLLLPNVVWDAQLFFPDNFYVSMIEWVFHTIEIFKKSPELNLIIRIHPAEIKRHSPTRQPLYEEIFKQFDKLPANILIIKNDNKISTPQLAYRSKAVIVYGSKAGIEFSTLGIPVIVTGESWIRNKGFAFDINSRDQYEEIFRDLESIKMSKDQITLSRKFAYHFFFTRAIKISEIVSDKNNLGLMPKKDLLYSGKISNGLYKVIHYISNNKDFLYDEN